jgi:hypothetical protein
MTYVGKVGVLVLPRTSCFLLIYIYIYTHTHTHTRPVAPTGTQGIHHTPIWPYSVRPFWLGFYWRHSQNFVYVGNIIPLWFPSHFKLQVLSLDDEHHHYHLLLLYLPSGAKFRRHSLSIWIKNMDSYFHPNQQKSGWSKTIPGGINLQPLASTANDETC